MVNSSSAIQTHLVALYGETVGHAAFERVRALMERYRSSPSPSGTIAPEAKWRGGGAGGEGELSQRDAILITYADQVREPGLPPLRALAGFCERHLAGWVSGIHLLPFYPWTSDDGFSVKDYRAVDPALGDWEDVARVGGHFRLMFDAVVNHISAQSEWFRAFLRDDPRYRGYFIVVEGASDLSRDLSRVVRPRALPLLTTFTTPSGEKSVWTTFSDDQIDLDYRRPEVLLEIIDVLLFYVSRGAEFIRLDAIAYLWKEIGTPCIHLPQTHRLIQLFRAVLDEVAPDVLLITETNVPHADNVSYFGDGDPEAQMVYNFALPPLVLHTFRTGSARVLSDWAASLTLPSKRVTFFNFLASHDGIGLNPARGLLPQADMDALVQQVLAHGGLVSYKHNPDGRQSPYELNVSYFDALSDPHGGEPIEWQVDRFIAAQAILLSLVGVPGIYFHSLFGSRGWPEGVKQTGRNRTINRQKLERAALEGELADRASLRHQVFTRYAQLLKARASSPAFHPHGRQRVIECGEAVFAVLRLSPDGGERVLCLQNVSGGAGRAEMAWENTFGSVHPGENLTDLISGQRFHLPRGEGLDLRPYQVMWLASE